MPYRWTEDDTQAELTLWPHRSLPLRGFALVILCASGLISLPLLAMLGTAVLWGLLPFVTAAIGGLWFALRRSYRDGRLRERLTLSRDRIALSRTEPSRARRDWEANPHWVDVLIHETGGPVEDYLTLRGNAREVELGAFLSPEERRALRLDIVARLTALRAAASPP